MSLPGCLRMLKILVSVGVLPSMLVAMAKADRQGITLLLFHDIARALPCTHLGTSGT